MGVAVGVRVIVGVGVSVGVTTGVTVGVRVGVKVGFGVTEGVAVGVAVGVRVEVGVRVGVRVGVAVRVAVLVGVTVGVLVGVAVRVGVRVGVAVLVGVGVRVATGVLVGVAVGTTIPTAPICTRTNVSGSVTDWASTFPSVCPWSGAITGERRTSSSLASFATRTIVRLPPETEATIGGKRATFGQVAGPPIRAPTAPAGSAQLGLSINGSGVGRAFPSRRKRAISVNVTRVRISLSERMYTSPSSASSDALTAL